MAKRLLCILSNMNAGGAETFLMKLYRAVDRDKYQFDFCICVKEKCFYEDEILSLGGRIYRIPAKSESLKEFKKNLSDVIKKNGYKYVLRITANAAGLLDLKIAKQSGAEVCVARSSNSNAEGGLKTIALHQIGKMLYLKYVDKKIAPSDLAAIYTFGKQAFRKGEVKIIRNAIDYDLYAFNNDCREEVRKELNIDPNGIVIGHIGRFMQQKNHEKLIAVFEEVNRKNRNTVLLLIGNGELENHVKRLVSDKGLSDKVIFAGIRSDIPRVLSCMDVYLMPSLYEGMPNTVIEAQANGLHCVISQTITQEADITGLVKYVSLDASNEEWASTTLALAKESRVDTRIRFKENGYDINSTAKEFTKYVFGD